MKIIESNLVPEDGVYTGLQSGYTFTYNACAVGGSGEPRPFLGRTVNYGVRGINVPCVVTVVDGIAKSSLGE